MDFKEWQQILQHLQEEQRQRQQLLGTMAAVNCAATSISGAEVSPVRIMSWNVLADRCLRFHPYIQYGMDERNNLIRTQLNDYVQGKLMDIICLQEVDTGFIEEQVLNGTFKVLATHWGLACCICFRTDTWKLVGEKEVVELDDLISRHNGKATDEECNYGFASHFLRNNYGIIAKLERHSDGKQIVVCNTHLYWDPNFEYVKLCQAHYFMKRVEKFLINNSCPPPRGHNIVDPFSTTTTITPNNNSNIRSNSDCSVAALPPVIFCGDLNSQPGGLVHTYLTTGKVPPTFTATELVVKYHADILSVPGSWLKAELHCPFRIQSCYATTTNTSMIPPPFPPGTTSTSEERFPFTNVTDKFTGFLDYIFFQPDKFQVKSVIELPNSIEDLSRMYGSTLLPNHIWPSDHLIVGAELSFKE